MVRSERALHLLCTSAVSSLESRDAAAFVFSFADVESARACALAGWDAIRSDPIRSDPSPGITALVLSELE